MSSPLSIGIVGLHRFVPTDAVFHDTLDAWYGSGLDGSDLAHAKSCVNEHFDGLYIIEIEVEPSADEFDWSDITQPVPGSP